MTFSQALAVTVIARTMLCGQFDEPGPDRTPYERDLWRKLRATVVIVEMTVEEARALSQDDDLNLRSLGSTPEMLESARTQAADPPKDCAGFRFDFDRLVVTAFSYV